jgi:hypothetical protein
VEGVIRVLVWFWHLTGLRASILGWTVVAVLAVLLVTLATGLVLLWPRSLRWAVANRLHRAASRNEANIRGDTRRHLDEAVLTLGVARRSSLRSGHHDDAESMNRLIRQIELVRDRVAAHYAPSPANFPRQRREIDLDWIQASEAVEELCNALATQLREGTPMRPEQLGEAAEALRRIDDRRFTPP